MTTHTCYSGIMDSTGVFRCCEGQATFTHLNWTEGTSETGWPSGPLLPPAEVFPLIAAHLTDHDQSPETEAWLEAEFMLVALGNMNVQQGVAALHAKLPNVTFRAPEDTTT